MRMNPTDLADVGGATYTYLMNGAAPAGNWTGLFTPGERVRLRFINGSAMTYFDVRIPGLKMTVVAADGQPVHPVTVDEFRIATAETFDVIVEPSGQDAFTIFAQAMDRTGYRRRHAGGARGPARAGAGARSAAGADDGRHGPRRHARGGPRRGRTARDPHAGRIRHAAVPRIRRSETRQSAGRHADDDADVEARRSRHRPARQRPPRADLRRSREHVRRSRRPRARPHDRAAPDRPHGALRVVVRRHQVLRRRAAAPHLRRAPAHRARQRHDDDAPDPPARHVERPRRRRRRFHGAQAHHRHAAGHAAQLSRHAPTRWAAGRITATCCSTWKPACSAKCGSRKAGARDAALRARAMAAACSRSAACLLAAAALRARRSRHPIRTPATRAPAPRSPASADAPAAAPAAAPLPPFIPPLTDADRAAAFPDVDGHMIHGGGIHAYVLVDELEWRGGRDVSGGHWDVDGWIGGDRDRLWFRAEGARRRRPSRQRLPRAARARALGPAALALVDRRRRRPRWTAGRAIRRPGPRSASRASRRIASRLEATGYFGGDGRTQAAHRRRARSAADAARGRADAARGHARRQVG